ncbi:MAG TPA: disulfide bond formation protein B [Alphaproteobacteria bacterium]|nr:disulfide bond formation protein B [Alphaproteobacteria bacterium]
MNPAIAERPWLAPLLLAAISAAAILIAVASQIWGGLQPCVLCIWQRWAHGAAIALALVALAAAFLGWRRGAGLWTLFTGLAALIGTGIALYHVGVEQLWWAGTSGCGAGALFSTDGLDQLREQIEAAPIVRCSDVPWSLFGISMAGYNALLSAALGLFAFAAGAIALRRTA